MSIGERIKGARTMKGLSMRALADEVGVSATAISKYERDLDTPGSPILLRLSRVLGVKVEYFFRPTTATLSPPAYRRRKSLPAKQQDRVQAQVQEWLERYLEVESLFEEEPHVDLPPKRRIEALGEMEQVAIEVRDAWRLGCDPIEGLMELCEDKGIKVGLVNGHQDFDALTLCANEEIPVIVAKRDIPGDRQRLCLAHELGHLILEPVEGIDSEKAAYRFAGAFLVPRPVVEFELGTRRHSLDIHELYLLKQKYGLSMQAWIYRAKDVGIVTESAAIQLFKRFRQNGWHREEPGDQLPPEEPRRMKRLVMRALSEGIVSDARAAELLGESLTQFYQEEVEFHGGPTSEVRG